jgi:hypothetical protein
VRLDGATKPEQRQVLTQRFNSDPKIFCFILSTRRWAGGVGVVLWASSFGGGDWKVGWLPRAISVHLKHKQAGINAAGSAAGAGPSLHLTRALPTWPATSRSGGVGMNLIGADTVIFYDSGWCHHTV